MRGKAGGAVQEGGDPRITPAYAGKSLEQAHALANNQGSPPPMRGKVSIIQLPFRLCGITPAYAGKSDVVHRSTRDI